MNYEELKAKYIAERNTMPPAEADAMRLELNRLHKIEATAKLKAMFLNGEEIDTHTFCTMRVELGLADVPDWFKHSVTGISAKGYSSYKLQKRQASLVQKFATELAIALGGAQ